MHVPQTEVVLRHDGAELAHITLPPGEYVIGRGTDAAIHADTPLLSRQHARLVLNSDAIFIEDLGSSNGTFVGDRPVTARTRLFPNQSVRLGDVSLEVHRQRTDSSPEFSLAPAQKAIRRHLPPEILTDKRYAIGSIVARGGMGAILDARQNATKRTVAMKVMLDTNDEADVLRFIGEAQVTAQLDHPNIVPIYELGVDEQGQLFYTMKMVRGITLKKVLELLAAGTEATVKKFPLPALLTIFQKVCDAIAFAHSKGVIHRDLKPENIMLGDFGSVLVMDWGLAKMLRSAGNPARETEPGGQDCPPYVASARDAEPALGSTMAGTIMGTPQYMAPEQARGEVETMDQRADIYALGAILYHLLALRPSVSGKDAWDIVGKVGRGEIEPLQVLAQRRKDAKKDKGGDADSPIASSRLCANHLPGGRIPDSLAAVVRKAMALEPAARYPHVEALQADILAYQNGFATSAEKAGAWKQFTLLVKRHKATSIGLAALLLVSIGFTAKVIAEGRRAERALADLRGTAPTFHAQAIALLNDGKFDDAIEKIGFAIKLDEANADYRLFRANLRQAMQRISEAAEEYRRVLALRPGDNSAKTNLALCEQLLAEAGGASLSRKQQQRLLSALREQKRLVEAGPLNALLEPDMAIAEVTLRARLREYQKQPSWKNDRVSRLSDGTFKVDLGSLALGDLSLLKGQPISVLLLRNTNVADLRPLQGLLLKELELAATKAADLAPLRGMPLENLSLTGTLVADLAPLQGMKLRVLTLSDTGVTDLTPLAGMPLESLSIHATRVMDLSPLRGMPLTSLTATNCGGLSDLTPLATCTKLQRFVFTNTAVRDLTPLAKLHLTELRGDGSRVTDFAPLRGQPLRIVNLANRPPGADVSPLAECPTLEEITLPEKAKNVDSLRQLPHLKRISTRATNNIPLQTVAEFWAEYDAQQAAGRK